MKIVVLNECFLSPSHIEELQQLGELTVYNNAADLNTATERAYDADIVLADMFESPLKADLLNALPNLKYLGVNTTGYDQVDMDAVRARKITFTNVPVYGTEAVAEHVFALLLSLARNIVLQDKAVAEKGPYHTDPGNQSHRAYRGHTLSGKTFGIYGLGAIGLHAAKIAQGFGMKVIAHNRTPKTIQGVEMVSFDDLLTQSDVLSLHCALNAETKNLINEQTLAKMKHGTYLINTAGVDCVNTKALKKALDEGRIAGAGLDILDDMSKNNPLLGMDNVLITPHTAWFTAEAMNNIGGIMTQSVKAFVKGTPINTVS